MRVSPSQIKVWHECSQRWHYNYKQGLKPKKPKRVFDKGLYFHELLHVYYHTVAAGYTPGSDFTIDFMESRLKSDLASLDMDNLQVMQSIMPLVRKFVAWQSAQIDNDIAEILGVEHEFYYEMGNVTMHGIIDLVYRTKSTGKIRIRDHKTSEQKNSWFQDKLMMNEQLPFYDFAISNLFGEKVERVEVNFVNTYPYKTPPANAELFKLFTWQYSHNYINEFAVNLTKTHMLMETDPIRNLSACGFCDYKTLCHLEMNGQSTRIALTAYDKREV